MKDKEQSLVICIILNILLIPFKTVNHLFHLLLCVLLVIIALVNYIGEKCIIFMRKFDKRINKSESAIKNKLIKKN